MAKLLILVVATAWVVVLIPPMLRSRVDNRPNSSVTDFQRQLHRLQSTNAPTRGSMRGMGRPLAQSSSPLQRQAATGRPGQVAPVRHGAARQASLRSGGTAVRDRTGETTRLRSHGDPSGGQRRPQLPREPQRPQRADGQRRQPAAPQRRSQHTAPSARRPADRTGPNRRPAPTQALDPAVLVRRRRTNVLFILAVTTACTMFLAYTTKSGVMLFAFGVSFVITCLYVYVLAQLREREQVGWDTTWLEHR